ncbi:hypothetical protein F4803DRAFT_554295 [Xylaria telfairii]|nr:hypothetical protein F4803DRAFT_554295 [Xylaria telfairii]
MPSITTCIPAQTQTQNAQNPTSPLEIDISSFQDIKKAKIDPEKLVALLRRRFGAGRYEIYTIHNVYSIRAPERLSQNDIELCK